MAEDPEDPEVPEEEEEFGPAAPPLILGAGDVAIPDTDWLDRDSGVTGPIAIRVTESLDVEYLDGETRVWLAASVPPGPRRAKTN